MKRTQTAEQVGALLGIRPGSVRRWVRDGAPHRVDGRKLFFDAGELLAWAKSKGKSLRRGRPSIPSDPVLLSLKVRKEQAIVERIERENQIEGAKFIDAAEEKKRDAAIVACVRKTAKEFFDGIGEKCAGKDAMEIQTILDDTAKAFLQYMSEPREIPEPAAAGASTP